MTKLHVHETSLTLLVYELLSCRFGRFRLHTSLWLRALIRSWQGVYVCKFRSTRMRFQFKKTLPVEHSSEHFCCVGTHFQAFMNLSDVFFFSFLTLLPMMIITGIFLRYNINHKIKRHTKQNKNSHLMVGLLVITYIVYIQ